MGHALDQFLIACEVYFIKTFKISVQRLVKHLNLLNKHRSVFLFKLFLHFYSHVAATKEKAIITEKTSAIGHNVIDDKFIEALKEDCTQVLM